MNKKGGTSLGVGGASILVIFILLCLTTFATLSLVSANADLKLTHKTAQAATEYYAADARAEEILAQIDACLEQTDDMVRREAALQAIERVTVEREADILSARFCVPITRERELSVALTVNTPGAPSRYTLTGWRDTATGTWEEDDTITLWDGGISE